MLSPTMRTAVLQATVLFAISLTLSHHLRQNMFAEVLEDEGIKNMIRVANDSVTRDAATRTAQLTLDAGNATDAFNSTTSSTNATATNGTLDESFYRLTLPRETAIFILLAALQYWWYMALERILPARPRGRGASVAEKGGDSEGREEEVVKKWIAQGRVRRASLNWCNTFLKWVLEMSVGRLGYHTLEHFLRVLLQFQSPRRLFVQLPSYLLFNFLGTLLFTNPFATLLSFVFVPAHQRIVFLAGADLAMSVFFNTVIRACAAWAVRTETAQEMMRNVTEMYVERKRREL